MDGLPFLHMVWAGWLFCAGESKVASPTCLAPNLGKTGRPWAQLTLPLSFFIASPSWVGRLLCMASTKSKQKLPGLLWTWLETGKTSPSHALGQCKSQASPSSRGGERSHYPMEGVACASEQRWNGDHCICRQSTQALAVCSYISRRKPQV